MKTGTVWLLRWMAIVAVPAMAAPPAPPAPSSPPTALTAPTAPTPSPAPGGAPRYLLASQAEMLDLLPPPPAADSQMQREDLKAVLDAQRAAHADGSIAHAIADVDLNCGSVADVLGDSGAVNRDPGVLSFLNEAAHEATALAGSAKNYWKRTRPFAYSSQVQALGDMATALAALTPAQLATLKVDVGAASAGTSGMLADLAHSSYPSGHATFGTVCAILLADMVPEKRAVLFARGLDYAHSRMILGAHFPSDLEGGRLTGTVAAQLLMQNPRFQHDFSSARINLREALGLPLQPAN
jgi:acid phosphatase (class A)